MVSRQNLPKDCGYHCGTIWFFLKERGIYSPRRVSRPILCEFLHPHVHILKEKSIQKAVNNEDSKESPCSVTSGFYSEKAKKKADLRTITYAYVQL